MLVDGTVHAGNQEERKAQALTNYSACVLMTST